MQRRLAVVFVLAVVAGSASAGEPHYIKTADIAYLGAADKSEYAQQLCQLDVFAPKGKEKYPTIVWFHGGGLTGGIRKSGEALAKHCTAKGVGVVLAGYRLSPKVKCPVYIEDAAAAVAWTIKNITKHKGDPNRVFVSGHSAGGYLTAMIGLDKKWLAKHEIKITEIAGLIPIAAQMVTHSTIRKENGKTKAYVDAFAPMHHARADCAPVLCIVGDMDSPDRIDESQMFNTVMQKAGHKHCNIQIVKGRNHGSIAGMFAKDNDEVAAMMLAFVKG